jgi:2-phosphosulfolactate phosphatase
MDFNAKPHSCAQPLLESLHAPLWHIIEGAEGCAFAVENHFVAVIVDALRASATAAMALDAGVTEIIAVPELEDAEAARDVYPDALLFGERGGLPPKGFDGGNSPRDVAIAAGRRIVFTTTTGAGRLVASWGAAATYMGTTLNASAVAAMAARHHTEVVLIPAGLMGDTTFDAQEDWVAATAIAMEAEAVIGRGADRYTHWCRRILQEGVPALFEEAPHAEKLRNVGLEADIAYCAQMNLTSAVPKGVARTAYGVLVQNAAGGFNKGPITATA